MGIARWLAIEDALEAGLPNAYMPALFQQKCAAVFEHGLEIALL